MVDALLGWLAPYLVYGLAVLGGVLVAWRHGRQQGQDRERSRHDKETLDRIQRGRNAVRDGRHTDDPAERLRRNDGRW